MPVYNVEQIWLKSAIESVRRQGYKNWELCIVDDCSTKDGISDYLLSIECRKIKVKILSQNSGISYATNTAAEMADGDYLILMDNDDELFESALEKFVLTAVQSDADVIYSDQDIVDTEGKHREPLCKPDWSPELLLSQMYIGHLLGFRKELFIKVGGFRKEYQGSQDYDLMLRMSRLTNKIVHIPEILYSWRSIPSSTATNPGAKPYAQTAGLRAVQDHLNAVYGNGKATVLETEQYFVYDVRYKMDYDPKVSVIIPTKDHIDLLKNTIETIQTRTEYNNYEIIILNNNSEEEKTFRYFDELRKKNSNIIIQDALFEFNWSKLNNLGIRMASGEVYIFLNNDVEISSYTWMRRLAEKALLPQIGIVGGLLLYEDNTIQHAGVIAGMGDWADHVFKGMKPIHYGSPFISPMVTRNVTAVTGACMAISKKTIEDIGNFDEEFLICGSDVEICIRAIHKGYRNIYDPYVRLYHFESKTRDPYIPQIDFELSDKMYKPYREYGDPYFNRQLDYFSCVPKLKNPGVYLEPSAVAPVIDQKKEYAVPDTHIAEINPYRFRKGDYPRIRINLLLPSINPEHVFGGISTALKFFEELTERSGFDKRIILVDAEPSEEAVRQYQHRYQFVSWDQESQETAQIVSYSARTGRTLSVSKGDYFIITGWWTGYCVQEASKDYEKETGQKPNIFINFIQDYEPGFYAWSTKYLLADATYRSDYPQIAIFNTKLLQEYFHKNGYSFFKEFSFDPVLNSALKEQLLQKKYFVKEKKILIYGRPGTERNAFSLIVAALKKWVEIDIYASEWEIISAGESYGDVYLGKNIYLRSVGKLSILEYAELLASSFAGISLMASPHPSYPPLEMSVFGVKVITNRFANKDLSSFNDFIVSLDTVSPYNIAEALKRICRNYCMIIKNKKANTEYIENKHVFDFINKINSFIKSNEEEVAQ